jgi:hypothetical protein
LPARGGVTLDPMPMLDTLSGRLKQRLQDFPPAGTGYWRVTALLADGRVFSRVYITDACALGFPDRTPFHAEDIVEIVSDAHRGNEASGAPVEIVSAVPISPWDDIAVLRSPDGRKRATFFDGLEIAMGGPTVGTVTVYADGTAWQVDNVNASMVWSSDSRRLAIPFWKGHVQRLMILDTETQTRSVGTAEYRVLQLEEFNGGVVRAIDSPIHVPAVVAITLGADVTAGTPQVR